MPGIAGYGAVIGDGIFDLGRACRPTRPFSISSAQCPWRGTGAGRRCGGSGLCALRSGAPAAGDRAAEDWCIGVNYADRNAEYKDGSDAPRYPSLFVRCATSFVGHGANLERPKVSTQLDYEGEIAFIVGRAGAISARAGGGTFSASPSPMRARSATGCATASST